MLLYIILTIGGLLSVSALVLLWFCVWKKRQRPQRQSSRLTELQLGKLLGAGGYGLVFKGTRSEEHVAVKLFKFDQRSLDSWERETKIYGMITPETVHVLRMLESGFDSNISTRWAAFKYYRKGSLFDTLLSRNISVDEMFLFAKSFLTGLEYLHTTAGTPGRPGIAHRDIKPENILVTDNDECCIADLGVATTAEMIDEDGTDLSSFKVGTIRYRAPEVLTLDTEQEERPRLDLQFCLRADIYAAGLLFWEMLARTSSTDFNRPYFNLPGHSLQDMIRAVVNEGMRPIIPALNGNVQLTLFSEIMQNAWIADSAARPTAEAMLRDIFEVLQ